MTDAPVAIVHDDEQFCGYIAESFAARGYRTRRFGGAQELLTSVANGDVPKVVLLDVSMPGAGGLDTLKTLRERHPECQVIMLSAREDARTIVEALRLGAADYIVKGDEPHAAVDRRLDAVVRRAHERADIAAHVAAFRKGAPQEDVHWSRMGRMREVEQLIERVADCDVPVLIRGESGAGKEVVARAIHARSPRASAPFVKINCAALPAELLETELFGHERGAFTGAESRRMGKFEHAVDGTILLDEIGEMSPALQAKLLHVLQDGIFTRVGGNEPIALRARVLAATHRELQKMMADGAFREDLFYRLGVIEIPVPPLRDRRDELPAMVAHFVARFSARFDRPVPDLTDELRRLFATYHWPGNVRELENTVKRLVLLQDADLIAQELRVRDSGAASAHLHRGVDRGEAPEVWPSGAMSSAAAGEDHDGAGRIDAPPTSTPWDFPDPAATGRVEESLPAVAKRAIQEAERAAISRTLASTRWNRKEAAERLGVSYKTLLTKIKELGLDATD